MKRFNLRVYAIIINDNDEVLLSDENRFGHSFTKFPGGGLEWGEGLKDCLEREIEEELGIDVTVGELFYVNEFFQQSAFREDDQLFSFYYRVYANDYIDVPISDHSVPLMEDGEKFRWAPIKGLSEEVLTFPVDKLIVNLLKKV
jgi:8-oxo-dGTP diphosphatase